MSRWHQGHSLAAGVVGGLILAQHVWTIGAGCFIAGLAVGRFWLVAGSMMVAIRKRIAAR